MASLERRLALLERARSNTDLRDMTDEELDAYIRVLDPGSPQFFRFAIARVMRHPSTLPLVEIDPDYA